MSTSHFGAVDLDQLQGVIARLEQDLAELRAIQIQRHTQVSRPDMDDADPEGRYAYQLLEDLNDSPQHGMRSGRNTPVAWDKEREALETAYARYLVDRQQPDDPKRHRDFILGWIACYDAHELRPRTVHFQVIEREHPQSQSRMIYGGLAPGSLEAMTGQSPPPTESH